MAIKGETSKSFANQTEMRKVFLSAPHKPRSAVHHS